MSNIKLILACIVLTFGLNASANAFTLFDKKFKNYNECLQYVEGATNDDALMRLLYLGCSGHYDGLTGSQWAIHLPDGATLLYQYGAGGETVEQAIEYLYKNYPKHFIKNPSVCKNCVYTPDGGQITGIPKSVTAYDAWLKAYRNDPIAFSPLSSPRWTETRDKSGVFDKFTQCIINNVESMITDDAKFKRIISCGDSAKMVRSSTLNMANPFSPEGKRKKEIEAINQRNDQRNAEIDRMNRFNTIQLMDLEMQMRRHNR